MYKLENSTDINEYVTAQEFPSPGKYNSNSDNGEMNTTNEVDFDFNTSKRASLLQSIPERDPKRNVSDATIKRRESDGNDRRLSNVNISMNQENINNDTFLYKKIIAMVIYQQFLICPALPVDRSSPIRCR